LVVLLLSGLVTFVVGGQPSAFAAVNVCATPTKDESNVTLSGVVNTYYPGAASVGAGSTSIAVGPPSPSGNPAIAAGDLLLVIQMQDATINATNTANYGGNDGTGRGQTALNNTGRYEYV
jgi:hypothetical protein